MISINLLPWRNLLRQKQYSTTKNIISYLCLVSLCVMLCWYYFEQQQIATQKTILQNQQQQFNTLLTEEKQLTKTQQQINDANHQQNIVQQIANMQIHNLELLNIISQITAPFISLDLIQNDSNNITISGTADSLIALADFMRKLTTVNWMKTASMQEIISINHNDANTSEKHFVVKISK